MKWANNLRRWTMRSIHAAILGSALLGSARIANAQAPSTAVSQGAKIHYTKSQSFDLPVVMDESFRATLHEIRLYVKTPTSSWKLQEIGQADLKRFNCRVTQDGEYWYSLATVDRTGRMTPADVNVEPPSQRVIVDSTPPVIVVQPWSGPQGELGLRCTVQDANPNHATLTAVCKTKMRDVPLEPVPNQPGVFRISGEDPLRFPVVFTVMDQAKNVGVKEVNVREIIGTALGSGPKDQAKLPATTPAPDLKHVAPLTPPRAELPPPGFEAQPVGKKETPGATVGNQVNRVDFPPPVLPLDPPAPVVPAVKDPPPANVGATKTPPPLETSIPGSGPLQLINTTRATVEYRIDQVGPSGVGKVEIYMTPDKGQTWHRLSEDLNKRSPTEINLPGDGVFGIRIVVANGNGFGGRAPVRGDPPHCTIEVDSTSPFVQLRSADVLPSSGQVELRWNATDKNLGSAPVALFYRTRPDGPWQVIARALKNDGTHRWAFPRDVGAQFFFKIEVTDQAGNMSQDVSRQPVVIDMTEPRATVIGVTGGGTVRPTP
jgi:hypothetical protein